MRRRSVEVAQDGAHLHVHHAHIPQVLVGGWRRAKAGAKGLLRSGEGQENAVIEDGEIALLIIWLLCVIFSVLRESSYGGTLTRSVQLFQRITARVPC